MVGATAVRSSVAVPDQADLPARGALAASDASRRARRRGNGGLVVLILAVALLLVGTLVGGLLLIGDGGHDDRADGQRGASSPPSVPSGPSGPETPSSPSAPSTSASPETRVRCWDPQLKVASVEDCGTPRDAQGLRWVFPSAMNQECRPVTEGDKDFVLSCRVTAPSGRQATIRYSQYAGTTVAALHNDEHYGEWGETRLAGPQRRVWTSPGPIRGQTWKVAAMYADAAFGVSVEAATRSDRDQVFRQAVTFRKRTDLWGRTVVD